MFTIHSNPGRHDCSGLTRRNFLRIGALGLGATALPDFLAWKAHATQTGRRFVNDKAVVFLYLGGGPSQIETFDPKMGVPDTIRSMTGEVKTSIPGVTFGGTFPKLAAHADKLAVVRSFVHRNANHDGGKKLFGGLNPQNASWSSVYARLAGSNHAVTGMPSNVFLSPMTFGHTAVLRHFDFYYSGPVTAGSLPAAYAPFHPALETDDKKKQAKSGSFVQSQQGLMNDLQLHLAAERFGDRWQLLKQLDNVKRGLDWRAVAGQGLSRYQQQAYDVLLRGVSKAFDLTKEDPKLLDRYDTSQFKTPEKRIKTEKNGKMSAQSQTVLGKQLLLARRLCEAGCGFVTVGMNDWDMHGNANSFSIPGGMEIMGGALDKAVAAFLTDLEERGLSDKILLVMTGEMGRTPKIQVSKDTGLPGRNHWASLGALMLAGGGLPMGQVIGASDRNGGAPAGEPVSPSQLMATVWHTLFNIGELRLQQGLPVDLLKTITDGQPIKELVG